MGLAFYGGDSSFNDLMTTADKAMYDNKKANKLVTKKSP